METICRIHAHIAFLFKNHPPKTKQDERRLCVGVSLRIYRLLSSILLADNLLAVEGFCKRAVWQDVAIFLASQIFIINNATSYDSKSAASASLGVGEFELFDVFEMRRHGFWARNEAKIWKLYMNVGLKKIMRTYIINYKRTLWL